VAYHWLPVFLTSWRAGAPLIEANFEANKAVAKAVGNDPSKFLAMNVYGDPLRLFPQ
jgi:hypothetical protein